MKNEANKLKMTRNKIRKWNLEKNTEIQNLSKNKITQFEFPVSNICKKKVDSMNYLI